MDLDVGTGQLVGCFSQSLSDDLGHEHHLAAGWGHVGVAGYLGSLQGSFHWNEKTTGRESNTSRQADRRLKESECQKTQ